MKILNDIVFLTSVFAPFASAFLMLICASFISKRFARVFTFLGFILPLFGIIYLLPNYLSGSEIWVNTYLFGYFTVNGVSALMLLLASLVGFCAYLWTLNTGESKSNTYWALLLFMQTGLMGMFATDNIIWMYAFHEFALIPTFIAICIWGGANRKAIAMEMAIYLTLGALVSLVGIVLLLSDKFSFLSFSLLALKDNLSGSNILSGKHLNLIFGFLFFGLGTLVSLFPFHTWAAKTYNSAPTAFSMLHAGVLKKFGLYFLLQVALVFIPVGFSNWFMLICILALGNLLYMGLCTMAQRDFKMMVSYSSVSHMGLCFMGLACVSVLGMGGTALLMFGHGLSVAALFICSEVLKNRFGTTDMFELGGIYKRMPVFAVLFIMAIFANIGLPGFANFWGELSIFVALWAKSPTICTLAVLGIIISAIYGLRAVANIFMGSENKPSEGVSDLHFSERLPLVILIFALLLVGFAPKLFTERLDSSLKEAQTYQTQTLEK